MKRPSNVELGAAETAILRALVRASSDAKPTALEIRGVDWTLLIDAAERHRLAPLVLEGLRARREDLPPVPAEAQSRLENIRNLELAKAVVRLHHVDELGAVAFRMGMDLHLLKGAAFAGTLYRDPGLRPMSDIDVLVSPPQFESWSRELEGLGYSLIEVSDHASCFRSRVSGVFVELHRHLTSSAAFLGLETGAILERARALDAGGGVRLRTLSWEDHLLHLCLHASFQHGFRQPGLNAWDARSIVERPDFDREVFVARARERRLAPWAYGGLAMTEAVFGSPILREILSGLEGSLPRSVARKTLGFRAERLLAPGPDAVFGTPFARLYWTGWSPATFSFLWELTRPRSPEIPESFGSRLGRILQLIRHHGFALVGSTSKTTPALSMGPTPASLGEVRDV